MSASRWMLWNVREIILPNPSVPRPSRGSLGNLGSLSVLENAIKCQGPHPLWLCRSVYRNFILVDEMIQLWIIAWEFGGWNSAYFEYACFASSLPSTVLRRWMDQILPYLGSYDEERHLFRSMMWALEITPSA
ncbi:hypothetical protein BDZ97DRAFT_1839938 [Flammula alnicola]|nr:hypothetical protein BDZ97DRAFT_1839938 [Flammula alnicola]